MELNIESHKIRLNEEDIEKINEMNYNRRNFDPNIWERLQGCSGFKIKEL